MANMALSDRQKSLFTIAALATKGDLDALRESLRVGLDAGLTISEINEILIQLYAYTGFPRSLNAINTFMSVLDARKIQGIQDVIGQAPHPFPAHKNKFELGCETQNRLMGVAHPAMPALNFVPIMDVFIKEHLFADIWGRDNLDFQSRELVTIAALACLGGVDLQLFTHLKIGLENDLTPELLAELVVVLSEQVGKEEADNMDQLLTRLYKVFHGEHLAPPQTDSHQSH